MLAYNINYFQTLMHRSESIVNANIAGNISIALTFTSSLYALNDCDTIWLISVSRVLSKGNL